MSPDTSPAIDARLRELYRQRTPGERLRMATGAFALGRALAAAGLRLANAGRSPAEARVALALRLHGEDLPLACVAAIRDGQALRLGDAR